MEALKILLAIEDYEGDIPDLKRDCQQGVLTPHPILISVDDGPYRLPEKTAAVVIVKGKGVIEVRDRLIIVINEVYFVPQGVEAVCEAEQDLKLYVFLRNDCSLLADKKDEEYWRVAEQYQREVIGIQDIHQLHSKKTVLPSLSEMKRQLALLSN